MNLHPFTLFFIIIVSIVLNLSDPDICNRTVPISQIQALRLFFLIFFRLIYDRIPVCIRKSIDLLPVSAHGAAFRTVGLIFRDIRRGEQGVDRHTEHAVGRAEDGADPAELRPIIFERLHCLHDGLACRRGCQKQEYVLVPDHGNHILSDNKVSGVHVFRRYDVDRIVGVHGHIEKAM